MPAERALASRSWPADLDQALSDLQHTGCAVLALPYRTPPSREVARSRARETLIQGTQAFFQCDAADVALHTVPGQAPVLTVRGRQVFASFSHESHLSLIALDVQGPVGIDVLHLENPAFLPDECLQLAQDYLPPDTASQMAALAEQARPAAFGRAWARHEAILKCRGRGLEEWHESMQTLYHTTLCQQVVTDTAYAAVCAQHRPLSLP